MEPQVDPVGSEQPRMIFDQIMNVQGSLILPQEGEHGVAQPARIAKFNGPASRTRRRMQEVGKTVKVDIPARGQLH